MEAIEENYNYSNLAIKPYKETNFKTLYNFKCKDGLGVVYGYTVFPGIDLFFNDFHMYNCKKICFSKREIIEINYCHKGRYENIFDGNKYEYLKEGDFSYNIVGKMCEPGGFPMGYYKGCSIFIDYYTAREFFQKNYIDLNIDIKKIKKILFKNNWYCIERNKVEADKMFGSLYNIPLINNMNFYKLRVLEILLFLSDIREQEPFKKDYYTKNQVKLIENIKKFISNNYSEKITVNELAKTYNISSNFLQNGFKDIYGKTISEYTRDFRIYTAAKMIKETDESIMKISLNVGYNNPSKFAAAFKKVIGKTPLRYRNT